MVSSASILGCADYHSSPELSQPANPSCTAIDKDFLFPLPLGLGRSIFLSVSVNFIIPGSTFVFPWLIYFSYPDVLKVHPSCSMCQRQSPTTFLCMFIPRFARSPSIRG